MIKFREKQEQQISNYDAELISLVQQHEFLYDTKNSDYRNLPLRASVWSLIARTLTVHDQNVVQKRWKVLREKFSVAFIKYKKTGITSNWPLYASCQFLEPFVNLKPDVEKEDEEAVDVKPSPPKSPFDENELTRLVKERPILYDKRHEDFRAAKLRKRSWIEISNITGWDVRTLQKRWRVMRDRFVRELRRTKNVETDKEINCSAFFRDMMFLVKHVKSKRYEVEATDMNSDVSQDNWDHHGSSEEDNKLQIDQVETCIIAEPAKETHLEENYDIDEPEYVECYETETSNEPDNYEETYTEELFEAEEETFCEETVEEQALSDEEVVAVQDIPVNQWFKEKPEKRKQSRGSVERSVEPESKRKVQESDSSSTVSQPTRRLEETSDSTDENVMFGRTIGIMLQKYPSYLQTAVKLEIMQSLANFDIKHKVSK